MDTSKENLNNDQGFVGKPYATRRIIRNPDGTTRVVYVDSRTGREVNPKGYTVIESTNTMQPQVTPGVNTPQEPKDKTMTDTVRGVDSSRGDANIQSASQTGEKALTKTGQTYIDKPGWAGMLGFLPAPLGTIATVGNLGINANNVAAVNDQREMLGFAEKSTMSNLGGTLMDRNGYIGEAAVKNGAGTTSIAPVSFEAQDKNGRTAYTPNEARMREQVSQNLTEANQAQTDAAIKSFKEENPQTGFLSGLASSAKGLFANIFGTTPAAPTGGLAASIGNPSAFPTAPQAPTNSSGSPDDRDTDSTSGYSSPGLF